MRSSWVNYLKAIEQEMEKVKQDSDIVCFRGQSESSWNLKPSLFVKQSEKSMSDEILAIKGSALFFDFTTNA